MVHGQITADKVNARVIDMRLPGAGNAQAFPAWLIVATADNGTLDGTNFFTFELWHADEKDDATTLTAASAVKVPADDILGATEDGVFLPGVTEITLDGVIHEILKTYFLQYRGYKPCVQLRAIETGTADIDAFAMVMQYSGDIVNIKAPLVY